MEDSKAENDKRNWMTGIMDGSKTKESHSKASSFAKILIFESRENSKDVFHKRSTKCRRRNKNREGICVYSIRLGALE